MPPILDKCVLRLRSRGAGESQAYAICTAALQKAGKIPPARSKSEYGADYAGWSANRVTSSTLNAGFASYWPDFPAKDLNLFRQIRKVKETDRPGVFGFATLHSGEINLNPQAIQRHGNHPLWYGAVGLHEAMHALYGFGEHEATWAEQRLTAHHFGVAQLSFDKSEMNLATRIAAIAQVQREFDVTSGLRMRDFDHLVGLGFPVKIARKIVKVGRDGHKQMVAARALQSPAQTDRRKTLELTYPNMDATLDGVVTSFLAESFDASITKTLGNDRDAYQSAYQDTSLGMRGYRDASVMRPEGPQAIPNRAEPYAPYGGLRPYAARVFEQFVVQAAERGVGRELCGVHGIIPAIRLAGYNAAKLNNEHQAMREKGLQGLVPSLAEQGLFRLDGAPSDAHLLAMLHGWSPILDDLDTLNEAHNGSKTD